MAFSKLINPKKKRRVHAVKESPFPIPISTQEQTNDWFYYTGYLHDNYVEIKHSGDIDRLYKMGFFGKGTLSRSKPEFNQRYRYVDVPNSKGEVIHARVMSRRSYIRRLNRKLREDDKEEHHAEYDSTEEVWEDMEQSEILHEGDVPETNIHRKEIIKEETSDNSSVSMFTGINIKSSDSNEQWKESANFWETSDKGNNDELWEENADFWNTDSTVTSLNDKNKEKENVQQESEDFWAADDQNKTDVQQLSSKKTGLQNQTNLNFEEKLQNFSNNGSLKTNVPNMINEDDNKNTNTSSSCLNSVFVEKDTISVVQRGEHNSIPDRSDENSATCTCSENKNGHYSKGSDADDSENYDKDVDMPCVTNIQDKDDAKTFQHSERQTHTEDICPKKEDISKQPDEQTLANYENTVISDSDLDSLCKSDDEEGDLFIVDDSDSDLELSKKRKVTKKKWRPVLKRDPFFVQENLHLSFEEAFFLSYGLGCLVVKDENTKTPDLTEMWQVYSRRQKTFLPHYIAYHYYRSKGWVPKTGLKFGTDFLIYKEGPAFYHGSYSVIVKMVVDEVMTEDPRYQTRDLTWTNLAGLNRLTEQVAKEVLICYVIKPKHLSDEDFLSPKCIPEFQVKEILLSRWISSQEREKKTEEMP